MVKDSMLKYKQCHDMLRIIKENVNMVVFGGVKNCEVKSGPTLNTGSFQKLILGRFGMDPEAILGALQPLGGNTSTHSHLGEI